MDNHFDITGADFRALKVVLNSMADKDVRYYLNGLYVDQPQPGKVKLVSTDGHRLSYLDIDAPEGFRVPAQAQRKSESILPILPREHLVGKTGWPTGRKTVQGVRVTLNEKGWNWAEIDKSGAVKPWQAADRYRPGAIRHNPDGDEDLMPYIDGKFPEYARLIRVPDWKVTVPIGFFRDSLAWYVDVYEKIRAARGDPKMKPAKLVGGKAPSVICKMEGYPSIGIDLSDFGITPALAFSLKDMAGRYIPDDLPEPPFYDVTAEGEWYTDVRILNVKYFNPLVDFPGDFVELLGNRERDTGPEDLKGLQAKTVGGPELFTLIMQMMPKT